MARRLVDQSGSTEPDFFDIPKTVKLSTTLLERLRRRKDETGVPISTQIRRAIEHDLDAERRPGDTRVCADLEEQQRAALEQLSTRLRYRDAAQLMENLAAAALSAPPRAVIDFITGDLSATDNLPPRPASFAAADEYARRRMAEDKPTKQRKEGAA